MMKRIRSYISTRRHSGIRNGQAQADHQRAKADHYMRTLRGPQ